MGSYGLLILILVFGDIGALIGALLFATVGAYAGFAVGALFVAVLALITSSIPTSAGKRRQAITLKSAQENSATAPSQVAARWMLIAALIQLAIVALVGAGAALSSGLSTGIWALTELTGAALPISVMTAVTGALGGLTAARRS